MTLPIAIALLFLMAVAPVLPWRKASGELLPRATGRPGRPGRPGRRGLCAVRDPRGRAAAGLRPRHLRRRVGGPGAGALGAGSVADGPLLGFDPARAVLAGWRGLVGRANGGMVVHIGVVLIAVGLAAATAFGQHGEVHLRPGQTAELRRPHGGVPRDEHRLVRLPLGVPGRAAGRRWHRLLPGDQRVRGGVDPGGHTGHRLHGAARRLPFRVNRPRLAAGVRRRPALSEQRPTLRSGLLQPRAAARLASELLKSP